jgi:hypothetical protein
VGELKPQREDEGEDKLDKCFAIVNQLKIGGFILEIDGEGAVFPRRFGSLSHVFPQVIRSRMLMRHDGGNAWKDQGNWDGLTAVTLNAMECGTICFSKTERMHDLVIGLFINRYEFGRAI